MRKKTKMIIDPKYILIAISVICAILIVVSFKFQDKREPVLNSWLPRVMAS